MGVVYKNEYVEDNSTNSQSSGYGVPGSQRSREEAARSSPSYAQTEQRADGQWYGLNSVTGQWEQISRQTPQERGESQYGNVPKGGYDLNPPAGGIRIVNPETGISEPGVKQGNVYVPESKATIVKVTPTPIEQPQIIETFSSPFKINSFIGYKNVPAGYEGRQYGGQVPVYGDVWVLPSRTPVVYEPGATGYEEAWTPTGKSLKTIGGYDPTRGVFIIATPRGNGTSSKTLSEALGISEEAYTKGVPGFTGGQNIRQPSNIIDTIMPKAGATSVKNTTIVEDPFALRASPGQGNQIWWGDKSVNVDPVSMFIYEKSRGGVDWYNKMMGGSITNRAVGSLLPWVGGASMIGEMASGGVMSLEAIAQNPKGTTRAIISGQNWYGANHDVLEQKAAEELTPKITSYQQKSADYDKALSDYNKAVDDINRQGGADDATYQRMMGQKSTLEAQAKSLNMDYNNINDVLGSFQKQKIGITGGEVASSGVDALLFTGQLGMGAVESWGSADKIEVPGTKLYQGWRAQRVAEMVRVDQIRMDVAKAPLKAATKQTIDQLLQEDIARYGTEDLAYSGLRGEASTKYITSRHLPEFWEIRAPSGIVGEVGDVTAFGVGKNVLYGEVPTEQLSKLSFRTPEMPDTWTKPQELNLGGFSPSGKTGYIPDVKMPGHYVQAGIIKKMGVKPGFIDYLKSEEGTLSFAPTKLREVPVRTQLSSDYYGAKTITPQRLRGEDYEFTPFKKTWFKYDIKPAAVGIAGTASINDLIKTRMNYGVGSLTPRQNAMIEDLNIKQGQTQAQTQAIIMDTGIKQGSVQKTITTQTTQMKTISTGYPSFKIPSTTFFKPIKTSPILPPIIGGSSNGGGRGPLNRLLKTGKVYKNPLRTGISTTLPSINIMGTSNKIIKKRKSKSKGKKAKR